MQRNPHQGANEVGITAGASLICLKHYCISHRISLTYLLGHLIAMLKSLGIGNLKPSLWACSVSDVESDSASSSSSELSLSNGHTAAEIDWDNLGFGIDHLAPVSFTRLDMPDMY